MLRKIAREIKRLKCGQLLNYRNIVAISNVHKVTQIIGMLIINKHRKLEINKEERE